MIIRSKYIKPPKVGDKIWFYQTPNSVIRGGEYILTKDNFSKDDFELSNGEGGKATRDWIIKMLKEGYMKYVK